MQSLAIINQKGGVGKTTSAVSLSAGLVRASYRVLLVDLDPQGHCSVGVGVSHESLENSVTMSDVLVSLSPDIREAIHDTYLDGLKLVPSTIKLARVAPQLYAQNFREQRLAQALESLKDLKKEDRFDFVILDCPPSLDVLSTNAMVAANRFLIPSRPSAFDLRGISDLLDTLHSIKGRSNNDWDWRAFLTMTQKRSKVTNRAIEKLLEPLKDKMLETQIRQNEKQNRVGLGDETRDIFKSYPKSGAAKDYQQLVEEVLTIWKV